MNGFGDSIRFDQCKNCGAELAPGTRQCPNCQTPVAEPRPKRSALQRLVSWRHLRHLLIVAILLLLPHVPHGCNHLRYKLVLRPSSLVFEAVTRANEHPRVADLLGRPIHAGWLARGYVRGDETGWSEGKIWIPVTGTKAAGMLYARGGRAESPWVFSELRLTHEDGRVVDLLGPIPQPALVPLQDDPRVFIVPLGGVQGLGLDDLPEFYRKRYGIHVEVVDPIPLEPGTRNNVRGQLIFDELYKLMQRRLPRLAKNKSAFLIGVTDEDMYIRDPDWPFAYTAYNRFMRVGVVSSARFMPKPLHGNEALLRARIRKMVSRTIGFVVFGLPRSDDPSSVMYRDLYGSSSADLMSDNLEGLGARAVVDEFKTVHGMPPRVAEFLPDVGGYDDGKADDGYPCLQITKMSHGVTGPLNVTAKKCVQGLYLDGDVDEIEIDLRVGNVITRKTDLFIPGMIPLAATRCYRAWDNRARTFGHNTNLSWDAFLVGSRQPYTYIELIACDGNEVRYERISKGTGYADAVYEHRATAAFLRSRINWNGNGWNLKLRDGSMYLFPDSYYGKRSIDGALIAFRNAKGQAAKMERRERRNLRRVISPDGRSIMFEHDFADRIVKAVDDQNRKVTYRYDYGGRLVEVQGVQSVTRYSYGNTYLMSLEENGRGPVEFKYDEEGRIDRLSLPDRRSYRFRYELDSTDKDQVKRSFVTGPDGSVTKFDIQLD
jgi:YD repeat-containing protein